MMTNFPLDHFSQPCQVQFQHLSMATLKTFICGGHSALQKKVPKKSVKIGSHIYDLRVTNNRIFSEIWNNASATTSHSQELSHGAALPSASLPTLVAASSTYYEAK